MKKNNAITVHIYYTGENGSAKAFVKEMLTSGLVDEIRKEKGNRRYEYFFSVEDEETVLLVDSWDNQEAIDLHHASSIMDQIMELRIKYHLHMKVERYFLDETGRKVVTKICFLEKDFFRIMGKDYEIYNKNYPNGKFEIAIYLRNLKTNEILKVNRKCRIYFEKKGYEFFIPSV